MRTFSLCVAAALLAACAAESTSSAPDAATDAITADAADVAPDAPSPPDAGPDAKAPDAWPPDAASPPDAEADMTDVDAGPADVPSDGAADAATDAVSDGAVADVAVADVAEADVSDPLPADPAACAIEACGDQDAACDLDAGCKVAWTCLLGCLSADGSDPDEAVCAWECLWSDDEVLADGMEDLLGCAAEAGCIDDWVAEEPGQCWGHCGQFVPVYDCQCNPSCFSFGDCCDDICLSCYETYTDTCNCEPDCAGKTCGADNGCGGICGCDAGEKCVNDACVVTGQGCAGLCGLFVSGAACQCNDKCFEFGDCCEDICDVCEGTFAAQCVACEEACEDKACGEDNGCGGMCAGDCAGDAVCDPSVGCLGTGDTVCDAAVGEIAALDATLYESVDLFLPGDTLPPQIAAIVDSLVAEGNPCESGCVGDVSLVKAQAGMNGGVIERVLVGLAQWEPASNDGGVAKPEGGGWTMASLWAPPFGGPSGYKFAPSTATVYAGSDVIPEDVLMDLKTSATQAIEDSNTPDPVGSVYVGEEVQVDFLGCTISQYEVDFCQNYFGGVVMCIVYTLDAEFQVVNTNVKI